MLGDGGRQFVEYCSSGMWRRLCTGSETWTNTAGTVACRQLGYSDQGVTILAVSLLKLALLIP